MMTDPPRGQPGPKVMIDRATLRALRDALHQERRARDEVQQQLNRETEFSRRAAEETLEARDERERMRQLMAASMAYEKAAVAALSTEREGVRELRAALTEAHRERGLAEGRALEFRARLIEERDALAARAKDTESQLRQQLEERGRDGARIAHERDIARGEAQQLRALLPADEGPARLIARSRAYLLLGVAAVSALLALIVLPALLVSLFSGQRAEYLRLATGASPGVLLLLEAALLGVAYYLSTRALSELRDARPAGT